MQRLIYVNIIANYIILDLISYINFKTIHQNEYIFSKYLYVIET